MTSRPGAGPRSAIATGSRSCRSSLTDAGATDRALAEADPEVIVHAAAISRADVVFRDPDRGRAVNVGATARLADWCRQARTPAGLHLDRHGLRRLEALEPRGRPRRADPGLRSDQARRRAGRPGGPPRPGGADQPAVRPLALGPRSPRSTRRSPRSARASLRRSSGTSSGPRSTSPPPRRPWSDWRNRTCRA